MLTLAFATKPPDAADLSRRWHALLGAAQEIVDALPHAEVGRCVLSRDGTLFTGALDGLFTALGRRGVVFHPGRIRGAMPELKSGSDD